MQGILCVRPLWVLGGLPWEAGLNSQFSIHVHKSPGLMGFCFICGDNATCQRGAQKLVLGLKVKMKGSWNKRTSNLKNTCPTFGEINTRAAMNHEHLFFFVFQLYGLSWQKSDDAVFTCSFGRFFYRFGIFVKSFMSNQFLRNTPNFWNYIRTSSSNLKLGGFLHSKHHSFLTTTTKAQLKPSLTGNPIKHLRGHRKHEEGNSMK